MSAARAYGWVTVLGLSALVYVVSVATTGDFTANGPWAVLVVVALAFGGDIVYCAMVESGGEE